MKWLIGEEAMCAKTQNPFDRTCYIIKIFTSFPNFLLFSHTGQLAYILMKCRAMMGRYEIHSHIFSLLLQSNLNFILINERIKEILKIANFPFHSSLLVIPMVRLLPVPVERVAPFGQMVVPGNLITGNANNFRHFPLLFHIIVVVYLAKILLKKFL